MATTYKLKFNPFTNTFDYVVNSLDLSSGVNGILPLDNGGTNAQESNFAVSGIVFYDGVRLRSEGNMINADGVLIVDNAEINNVFVQDIQIGTGLPDGILFLNSLGIASTDTDLTFDGTQFTAPNLKIPSLTSGRVPYITTGGSVTDVSSFLFDGTDLTVPSLKISDLTSGRVIFSQASGASTDDSNLFWDNTNKRLGIGNAAPTSTLHVSGISQFFNGSALGAMDIGADVNATTRSNNVRKLGAIVAKDYTNTKTIEIFSIDSTSSTANEVNYGGRSGGSNYCATLLNFFTAVTSATGGTNRIRIYETGSIVFSSGGTTVPSTAPTDWTFYGNTAFGGNTSWVQAGVDTLAICGSDADMRIVSGDAGSIGSQFSLIEMSAANVLANAWGIVRQATTSGDRSLMFTHGTSSNTGGNTAMVKIMHTGELRGTASSAASPGFSFISDTDTGIYSAGANSLGISAGGVLSLSISTTALAVTDAINITTGTTTGTKIGTATSQKIGLWNATPIIQPTTGVAAATFVTNTSLIANDTATFDGYTIGQVVKALRNIGVLA